MMPLLPSTCVLLAAGFDWLEALLPFLFVVFWILSQVFAVFRRLQGGGAAVEPRRPPPLPDPAPVPARQPGPPVDELDPRNELERQIAEFLREAQGGKPSRRPRGAGAERQGRQERRVEPASRRKGERVAPQARVAGTEKLPVDKQSSDVSVARHVQEVFTHEIAHLRGTLVHEEPQAGSTPPPRPSQAEELVHLLRNPASIRQVMLLREVIDRPVDRW